MQQKNEGGASWQCLPLVDDLNESPSKKSRTEASIAETLENKTEMVRMSLVHNLGLVHSLQTIVDAQNLRDKLQRREVNLEEQRALEEGLVHRTNVSRHMLVLDSAIDTLTTKALEKQREDDPEGFAIAIASDESPPSQVRFGGYRFQITMVYTPLWRPEETWEASEDAPLDAAPLLLDICHCPGKDCPSVMRVIEKQLSRVGLSKYDICSGAGDGGGENEGQSGIHASLEADNPHYVRRRCLGHIAWRLADALLAEVTDYKLITRLCEYLCEGSTWTRLQGLATTPVLEGGLGLFPELSRTHAAVFGTTPGSIVPGRPESALEFLKFLRGKEHVLAPVCRRDVDDRHVADKTLDAVALLGDVRGRAGRSVVAELLHRALFLHRWVNVHPHIARVELLETLFQQGKDNLQDLGLDDLVIERIGTTRAELGVKGWDPCTWVELAVLLVYDDTELAQGALPEIMEFHSRLVARTVSHLALLEDNIHRTTWRAGGLLAPDATAAQASANALERQLLTTARARLTAFEQVLVGNGTYMENLRAFASASPAVCLWQNHGAYKPLFRFLALRFLLAPDQVLDCERVHASWQWQCTCRRALRLKALNAWLRLKQFLATHGNQFPLPDALAEPLRNEMAWLRGIHRQVREEDRVAERWRADFPYLERFNLRMADLHLVGEDAGPGLAAFRSAYQETSSVYIRKVFDEKAFFSFPGLSPDTFLYVLDSKTLAGREPRDEADAQSRPLVLCFFKKICEDEGEITVERLE